MDYKLEKDLIVNETGDVRTLIPAGMVVVQEATGKLTGVAEKDLTKAKSRIAKDIGVRDTAIALEAETKRLAMEAEAALPLEEERA